MQAIRPARGLAEAGWRLLEVLKAMTVRKLRTDTCRSPLGLAAAILKPIVMLAVFWVILEFLGMRGLAIRGNPVTFLLSGIFCFLLHTQTLTQVADAARASRRLLCHAPATVFAVALSRALSVLFVQLLAALVIIGGCELAGYPLGILDPARVLLPYMLAWLLGIGFGLIFMALGQAAPGTGDTLQMLYVRVQFVTAGKFWAANALPAELVDWFGWNPLMQIIDQIRGAAFVNYFPHHSALGYPIRVTLVALLLGLMCDRWVSRRFSLSRGRV